MASRSRSRAKTKIQFFSSQTARKHWDAVLGQDRPMKTWCRLNKILMGQLIRSVIKFFPDEWEKHKDNLGEIMVHECIGCGLPFYANAKKQRLCSETCGAYVWKSRRITDRHEPEVTSLNGAKDPSR